MRRRAVNCNTRSDRTLLTRDFDIVVVETDHGPEDFVGVFAQRVCGPPFLWAGRLFVVGTAIFSGTLYVLAVTDLKWLGAVTPLGGICLLGGWAALCWGIVTRPYSPGSAESH